LRPTSYGTAAIAAGALLLGAVSLFLIMASALGPEAFRPVVAGVSSLQEGLSGPERRSAAAFLVGLGAGLVAAGAAVLLLARRG
jgi:hypothetical protein